MTDVLVTGGAGYIGAHACKALSGAGYRPVVFDNLVYGREGAVRWGPFERGDILDRPRLDALFGAYDFAAVMHFAAFAYVGESVSDPGKYYRNNVLGSFNLVEAMRDHGVGKMVFSSTCATYGTPAIMPIAETTPQRPINPYGTTKLVVEQLLSDFHAAHALDSTSLRYFNAAGADPGGEIGECHDPETHLIPLAIEAAAGRGSELTIFGEDYDTPDGTCVRDYIHVTDLADAHVRALDRLGGGARCDALNLGTGTGVSVRQVIAAVDQAAGRPVPYRIGPRREGDPAILVADASKASAELGWRPAHSDVATLATTAWAWHESRNG